MKKTIIISGASRGIGAACAKLFAENNYNAVINFNKSENNAKILQNEIINNGGNAILVKADVSNYQQADILVKTAINEFGSVDVLINNAGISQYSLFTDTTEHDFDDIFNINVKSVYNLSRIVLPYLIRQQNGNIINISSMWGQVGASCEVLYSATKSAIIGMTKALAKEVAPSNIRVNAIAPGIIDTDMMSDFTEEDIKYLCNQTPLGKLGTPQDIAKTALFLASDNASFITGQIFGVNGGYII